MLRWKYQPNRSVTLDVLLDSSYDIVIPFQYPDKFYKGSLLSNQPIIGDTTKLMENSDRPLFTWFASINSFICEIKRYRPIIEDMPNWWILQRSNFLLIWLFNQLFCGKKFDQFWHWSLCCWVLISCQIDQHIVTSWPVIIYWFYSEK